jgi:hypothetical protein
VLLLPASALAWNARAFSAQDESLLVSLVNQRRAGAGQAALVADATLTTEARSRSKRLGDRRIFSHSIDGRSAFDELREMGYCLQEGAENLAWNSYPDDQATRVAWQGLQQSPAHLANIVGRTYTRIGVGAYKAADGTHVYVLLFVRKCGASPTKAPATTTPARRAAPRIPPATATPAPKASEPPAEPVLQERDFGDEPFMPLDAERPRPVSRWAPERRSFLQEFVELLVQLLQALAAAPG